MEHEDGGDEEDAGDDMPAFEVDVTVRHLKVMPLVHDGDDGRDGRHQRDPKGELVRDEVVDDLLEEAVRLAVRTDAPVASLVA